MNRHVGALAILGIGLLCPRLAAPGDCMLRGCEKHWRAPDDAGAAPSQGARYSLTGSVIDQTQAFVPKAQVILTEISRDKKHKTRSDRDGRFGFDDLPPGDYLLNVALRGFTSMKSDVSISTQDVTHDVRLEVGGLYEAVTITRAQVVMLPSDTHTFPRREPPRCEGSTERPIGGNILPPIKIRDVRPVYPRHLKTAGIRAHVVVQARVGADGLVSRPMVVLPVREEFADAATEAIAQWLFDPVYLNCQPMAVRLTVDVEFTDGR